MNFVVLVCGRLFGNKTRTVMSYNFGLGESSLDHRKREEFLAISNV